MTLNSIRNRDWSHLLGNHVTASEALKELGLSPDAYEDAVVTALRKYESEVGPTTDFEECENGDEMSVISEERNEMFRRMAHGLIKDARN